MPFITGATVDFTDYSAPGTPRILNVPDAWGDVAVEDIWDTLSEIGARIENLCFKKLVARTLGGGRSVLSATKATGITCVGNNVQVKFEDLLGPTYVIKRVVDGNWIAIDHLGDPMESMASSTFVNWKNEADVSAAISLVTPGFTPADATLLASVPADVWAHVLTSALPTASAGFRLLLIERAASGRVRIDFTPTPPQVVIYDDDNTTELRRLDLTAEIAPVLAQTNVQTERVPV